MNAYMGMFRQLVRCDACKGPSCHSAATPRAGKPIASHPIPVSCDSVDLGRRSLKPQELILRICSALMWLTSVSDPS